jgi:Fe-S-cluster-containing hydrogenase component 2
MQRKVLLVDVDKCTGCRTCELACSWVHEGVFNPLKSRISVVSWRKEGIDIPMVCQQCDTPLCRDVCPTGAISRDPETWAMVVDETKCIGCRMCIMACPFGGLSLHPEKNVVVKCDLCGGDPACVKYCPVGALQYIEADKLGLAKKRAGAARLSELLSLVTKEAS